MNAWSVCRQRLCLRRVHRGATPALARSLVPTATAGPITSKVLLSRTDCADLLRSLLEILGVERRHLRKDSIPAQDRRIPYDVDAVMPQCNERVSSAVLDALVASRRPCRNRSCECDWRESERWPMRAP